MDAVDGVGGGDDKDDDDGGDDDDADDDDAGVIDVMITIQPWDSEINLIMAVMLIVRRWN